MINNSDHINIMSIHDDYEEEEEDDDFIPTVIQNDDPIWAPALPLRKSTGILRKSSKSFSNVKDNNGTLSFKYLIWLFAICSALAGIQFVYAIQFAIGTPLFNQKFKLKPSTITWIQSTAGPISGFIIQPIIGIYSDSCKSRFGRRRPFILAGAIVCVLSLLLIAFSPRIGEILGDNPYGDQPNDYKAGIPIAIIGFCIMNISVNVMQGPCRSLISDIVDSKMQHYGNAMVTITMCLANIIACIIGAQLSVIKDCYRNIFVIGAVFVAVSVIPTLVASKEEQMFIESPSSIVAAFKKIILTFFRMQRELKLISFVLFISWFGFSPFMVSITNYFGQNISPNDYNYGVKLGFYALAVYSAVSFLFGFVMPSMINLIGEKLTYSLTHIIGGVAFFLIWFLDSPSVVVAIVLTGLVGFTFATFNSIPFTLLMDHIDKQDAGLYMGVLNSATVVSQTISIFTSGIVEASRNENSSWAIGYGGVFTFLAAIVCFILPKRNNKIQEDYEKLIAESILI